MVLLAWRSSWAYAFSRNRSAIAWRTVAGAFALQFGLGAFVLRVPWGQSLLSSLTEGVNGLLNYANEGISFLFGEIVGDSIGFTFAFKVLPIIVFFASLIAVLYHVGIMKWVIASSAVPWSASWGPPRPSP